MVALFEGRGKQWDMPGWWQTLSGIAIEHKLFQRECYAKCMGVSSINWYLSFAGGFTGDCQTMPPFATYFPAWASLSGPLYWKAGLFQVLKQLSSLLSRPPIYPWLPPSNCSVWCFRWPFSWRNQLSKIILFGPETIILCNTLSYSMPHVRFCLLIFCSYCKQPLKKVLH